METEVSRTKSQQHTPKSVCSQPQQSELSPRKLSFYRLHNRWCSGQGLIEASKETGLGWGHSTLDPQNGHGFCGSRKSECAELLITGIEGDGAGVVYAAWQLAFLSSLLLTAHLPTCITRRQQAIPQVLQSLSATWLNRIGFQTLGFRLA